MARVFDRGRGLAVLLTRPKPRTTGQVAPAPGGFRQPSLLSTLVLVWQECRCVAGNGPGTTSRCDDRSWPRAFFVRSRCLAALELRAANGRNAREQPLRFADGMSRNGHLRPGWDSQVQVVNRPVLGLEQSSRGSDDFLLSQEVAMTVARTRSRATCAVIPPHQQTRFRLKTMIILMRTFS
jgi:hypothetical protein